MRKIIIIAIASCTIVLLLGYTGYRGYQVWKQEHWLDMAREFAAKGDINSMSLSLQQALRLNPQNQEAARMMAGLADDIHSPAALVWRQRLLDMEPNSLEARLALAKTALAFNAFNVASNVLAGVDEAGRKTAHYQNTAGALAAGMGQKAEAEKCFYEAARLEPANLVLQMNLQVLRLHSSNSVDQAAARGEIRQIAGSSTNAAIRIKAERELVLDALNHDDFTTALNFSKALAQPTNAAFADRLLRVEVLYRTKSPEYQPALLACQQAAAAAPANVSQMAEWMMKNTSPTVTLAWLQSLPAQTLTNQPAVLLVSECQMQLQEWGALQATLKNQDWQDLDFLRHALLARCLREQKQSAGATAEWGVALRIASNQKGSLIALFRLVAEWRWRSEAEEVLWMVASRYPEEKWAPPVLAQALIASGRTLPLMKLFDTLYKRMPDNLENMNNLAFVAMLLDAQEVKSFELAKEVYGKMPQKPAYVSTYAYALYLQKRYSEAIDVMEKLAPKDLEDPANAGYYGLILKASGNTQKANTYLQIALKGPLLPEEAKVFKQALGH
jgi:hypothetical protein